MGVSLDHTTYIIPPPSSTRHVHPRTPTQIELDSHLHTIRGTSQNVSNRFFDKTFTLIVDPSTRAGAAGEHSPVDALVPSIVAEYGVVEGVDVGSFRTTSASASADEPGWERLDWVGDDMIWKECQDATRRANAIMENSDDSVLWFEKYGSNWIKGVGMLFSIPLVNIMLNGTYSTGGYRLSPDAYIQMAMQLAWYKTRNEFTATYETVLTRMFKQGRTETLRSFSVESRQWVLSMVDPKATVHIFCRSLISRRSDNLYRMRTGSNSFEKLSTHTAVEHVKL